MRREEEGGWGREGYWKVPGCPGAWAGRQAQRPEPASEWGEHYAATGSVPNSSATSPRCRWPRSPVHCSVRASCAARWPRPVARGRRRGGFGSDRAGPASGHGAPSGARRRKASYLLVRGAREVEIPPWRPRAPALEFYRLAVLWIASTTDEARPEMLLFQGYAYSDLSHLDQARADQRVVLRTSLGDKAGTTATTVAEHDRRAAPENDTLNRFDEALALRELMEDGPEGASLTGKAAVDQDGPHRVSSQAGARPPAVRGRGAGETTRSIYVGHAVPGFGHEMAFAGFGIRRPSPTNCGNCRRPASAFYSGRL